MLNSVPSQSPPSPRLAKAGRGVTAQSAALSVLPLRLDGFRWALFFLVIINVSRIHQYFGLIAKLRPAMTLVAFIAFYAVANPRRLAPEGLFRSTEARLIALLAVFVCVGMPFGISLGSSGRYVLESYSKVIVGAFLLILGIRGTLDLWALVWAYVVSCGLLAWMALFVFGISKSSGSSVTRLSDLYTFDANDIGVVFMVGLALTLLVFQHTKGMQKLAAMAVVIGIAASIARSGSRGAFVGLIVTGTALLFMLRTVSVAKRLAFVIVTGIALTLWAPPGYWDQMSTLLNPKQDYNWETTNGRRQVALRGISYMVQFPIFGLGIHNFGRAECMGDLSDKVRNHVIGTGLRCTPPHNTWVESGAEAGVPGLLIFASLVFGGIWRMRRLRRRMPKAWKNGDPEQRFLYDASMFFAVAMIGFAITSSFVTFAWIDIIYILAALMAGLDLSVRHRLARDAKQPTPAVSPQRPGLQPVPVPITLPVM